MEFFKNLLGLTNQLGGRNARVGDRVVDLDTGNRGIIIAERYEHQYTNLVMQPDGRGRAYERGINKFELETEYDERQRRAQQSSSEDIRNFERLAREQQRRIEEEQQAYLAKQLSPVSVARPAPVSVARPAPVSVARPVSSEGEEWEVGKRYKNKFTGNEGEIREKIKYSEIPAWLCFEDYESGSSEWVCLFEIEMTSVTGETPFITHFNGTPSEIKALGNKSVDFITHLVNDYITKFARTTYPMLKAEELKKIGDESSKSFQNIKIIEGLYIIPLLKQKIGSIMLMLKDWEGFNWDALTRFYQGKIGSMFTLDKLFLYLIGHLYNRIMLIKKISKECEETNEESPLSLSLSPEQSSSVGKGMYTEATASSKAYAEAVARVRERDAARSGPLLAVSRTQSAREREAARSAPLLAAAAQPVPLQATVVDPFEGLSRTLACKDLQLYSSSIVTFETTIVKSDRLKVPRMEVPRMEAPAILWEMIGTHVLTNEASLLLFKFDKGGISYYQKDFFDKYDLGVTGCFKNEVPCICIEGGPKILAFARWVIHNKQKHRLEQIRELEIQALKFYTVFKQEYQTGLNQCILIAVLFKKLRDKMDESPFKKLVALSYEECLVEQSRPESRPESRQESRPVSRRETVRVPLPEESEASQTLWEAARHQVRQNSNEAALMRTPFASLMLPHLSQVRGQERRPIEVHGVPFRLPSAPFHGEHLQMSRQPIGRLRQTSSEQKCEDLPTASAREHCARGWRHADGPNVPSRH
jgi:hypothetical protein